MNDRLKFKVWNKEDKKFEDEDFYLDDEGNLCCDTWDDGLVGAGDNYTVVCCTGLKDKIGKLIYEGDIVRVPIDSIKLYNIDYVVIWDRKEWQLAQLNKNYKKCKNCANRNKTKCSYCKEYFMATGHTNFKDFYNGCVIGNKFESPELLEEI